MGRTRRQQQHVLKVASTDDHAAGSSSEVAPQTRDLGYPPTDSASDIEEERVLEAGADSEPRAISAKEGKGSHGGGGEPIPIRNGDGSTKMMGIREGLANLDISGHREGREIKRETVRLDGTTLEGGGQLGKFCSYSITISQKQWQ